ncbi:hypothetical protein ABZ312_11330 [Streptomyces sp. NPDC006207]
MAHTDDELREAAARSGISFDYLMRLRAAGEPTADDPRADNALVKQFTVIFDHYVARTLSGPDPIGALRQFGLTATADALEAALLKR